MSLIPTLLMGIRRVSGVFWMSGIMLRSRGIALLTISLPRSASAALHVGAKQSAAVSRKPRADMNLEAFWPHQGIAILLNNTYCWQTKRPAQLIRSTI